MTRGLGFTTYNDAIHPASTINGLSITAKKRDADTMDSGTSSSRKRRRTGHSFVDPGDGDIAQKRVYMESRADDLYLDVRDGARTSLDNITNFGLDVLGNQYGRVKHRSMRPKSVKSISTNFPSSNSLRAQVMRKMASKYAMPSTPLTRIGHLEYKSTQGFVDRPPLNEANDTSTRAHDPLEHTLNLRKGYSFTRHHQDTATAPKRQPVEHAWSIGRRSSGNFALHSQQPDSNFNTDNTAVDVKRETLRKELDGLSQGLTPPTVVGVRSAILTR